MADLTRVFPAREGLILLMPDGRELPATGAVIDLDDLFWARRLADGDAVTRAPKASEEPKAALPAPTTTEKGA